MSSKRDIRVVIPLFPDSQPLDWCGPKSVFDSTSPSRPTTSSLPFSLTTLIAADTLDPVSCTGGLRVLPDLTLDQAETEKWDAILLPGGSGARPWAEGNTRVKRFLERKVPETEYIFTVCTGSWLLASVGLLKGQKATTNKAAYKDVISDTKDQGVTWVPKARWVVSEKYWTSSGVTAGIDMAAAIVRYFVAQGIEDEKEAKVVGDRALGSLEVIEAEKNEDPYADYYGLI